METTLLFRLFIAFILISGFGITIYCRIRATASDKKRSSGVEGPFYFNFLRIILFALFMTFLGVYLVKPQAVSWGFIDIPDLVRWGGVIVAILVLPWQYWVLISLGKNISPTAQTRENASLVTTGPYGFVRHPLYLTGTVGFSSLAVMTGIWILGVMLILIIPFLIIRSPKEEANLIKKFGDEYRDYQKKTKRFIPFVW